VPDTAKEALQHLFDDGTRVVAVATRAAPTRTNPAPADERDLRLAGFLTFVDRPKADVRASITRLDQLGIAVKVITGNNGTDAARVCTDLGIDVTGVLTGADLDRLDDDGLADAILLTTVFARVSPDQKSRVIRIARRSGADVGLLGDGVNDAVALHAADVGISVESANEVARDGADTVLLDKDLGVLADGVTEGRRIFANTLKYALMATRVSSPRARRRPDVELPQNQAAAMAQGPTSPGIGSKVPAERSERRRRNEVGTIERSGGCRARRSWSWVGTSAA
jgi:P-type Mg2+ transporter